MENVRNIDNLKDITSFNKLELNRTLKKLIRDLVIYYISGLEN